MLVRERWSRKHGLKIIPGKAIISDVIGSTSEENTWVCDYCKDEWVEDNDNLWLVSDICVTCDRTSHLQCSGLRYKKKQYYDRDLESLHLSCYKCDYLSIYLSIYLRRLSTSQSIYK